MAPLQEVGFVSGVTALEGQSQLYKQMGLLKQKGIGRKANRNRGCGGASRYPATGETLWGRGLGTY